MPDLHSLATFSGLMTFAGVLAFLSKRLIAAATLFIIVGSAGTAIFWDRWSERAGAQVDVNALWMAPVPSGAEMAMLLTHSPLLLAGLLILAMTVRGKAWVKGGQNDDVRD